MHKKESKSKNLDSISKADGHLVYMDRKLALHVTLSQLNQFKYKCLVTRVTFAKT